MNTIYETIGAAKEYCDYAVDIYTNCPHKCSYCYAKAKAERKHGDFSFKGMRNNILEETRKYLMAHKELSGKMIFLGFSSDAFPVHEDISGTIKMIELLKEFGCKVMVCTKGCLTDDVKTAIELVDSVGISLTCDEAMASKYEENAASVSDRIALLKYAKSKGKETWISFEPVLEADFVYDTLKSDFMDYVDVVKLGKLNHMMISDLTGNKADDIDWSVYVNTVVKICEERHINYKIKDALKRFL